MLKPEFTQSLGRVLYKPYEIRRAVVRACNVTKDVVVTLYRLSLIGDLSRAELMMMTIADVIKQLVEAHEEGIDINLNK